MKAKIYVIIAWYDGIHMEEIHSCLVWAIIENLRKFFIVTSFAHSCLFSYFFNSWDRKGDFSSDRRKLFKSFVGNYKKKQSDFKSVFLVNRITKKKIRRGGRGEERQKPFNKWKLQSALVLKSSYWQVSISNKSNFPNTPHHVLSLPQYPHVLKK